jgi:hypothetical protein
MSCSKDVPQSGHMVLEIWQKKSWGQPNKRGPDIEECALYLQGNNTQRPGRTQLPNWGLQATVAPYTRPRYRTGAGTVPVPKAPQTAVQGHDDAILLCVTTE